MLREVLQPRRLAERMIAGNRDQLMWLLGRHPGHHCGIVAATIVAGPGQFVVVDQREPSGRQHLQRAARRETLDRRHRQ